MNNYIFLIAYYFYVLVDTFALISFLIIVNMNFTSNLIILIVVIQVAAAGDKINHFEEQEQMIKKHSRKVEKMHADLEGKILERHTEL